MSITFRGRCVVREVRQSSSAHMEQFLTAADWFIKNQNERGGWHVPVDR